MKIFRNVLSLETLDRCSQELAYLMDKPVWRCSDQFWQDQIQVGVSGVCTSTFASPELTEMVSNCIRPYVPEADSFSVQHYIWHRGSGISTHNDWVYKFAATIYLNQSWNIDYGGIFVWEDAHTRELSALSPEYNMMVVNTERENHLVTHMSMMAPEKRITLQIWGN